MRAASPSDAELLPAAEPCQEYICLLHVRLAEIIAIADAISLTCIPYIDDRLLESPRDYATRSCRYRKPRCECYASVGSGERSVHQPDDVRAGVDMAKDCTTDGVGEEDQSAMGSR